MTVLANLALAFLLAQYVPGPRMRGPLPPVNPGGANTDAVATFAGTFKSADKKYLTIEVEDGQIMRMYITGATKFFRDDKPAKAADFNSGEKVSVDASRDARFNLIAVRVEPAKPARAPAPKPDPQP